MPIVSIVLPVYNHANFIREAIDSIRHQTYQNIELIVVNDGSTDHLKEVLKHTSLSCMRLLDLPHQGLPHALNAGFQAARGTYVTWTSADNILLPHCIERLYIQLAQRPRHGAIYADYIQIDAVGMPLRVMSKGPYRLRLMMNFGPAFLIRKDVANQAGPFDSTLMGFEDRDFSMRVAQIAPVAWLSEVLYLYRVHDESLTGRLIEDRAHRRAIRRRLYHKWRHLPNRISIKAL